MNTVFPDFQDSIQKAIGIWSPRLVHIGGKGLPFRSGIALGSSLVASLARQANDGEDVPVWTAEGRGSGRVKAWDRSNGLVLIETEQPTLKGLPELKAAEPLPALGQALVRLAYASPQGIEASLSIARFIGGSTNWGVRELAHYFQLDGIAYPGFWGALVLDLEGGLRGIVASNANGNEGWTVPALDWLNAIEELKREGSPTPGWVGIAMASVALSKEQERAAGQPNGALIQSLATGSPAQASGLRPGDIVLSVDGKAQGAEGEGFPKLRAGKAYALSLLRGETTMNISLTPTARP